MKWSLLAVSALLYAVAFLYMPWCWWMIFLYPIPFLIAAMRYHLRFYEGFFWGCIAFGLHLGGVFWALIRMSHGMMLLKLVPCAIALVYIASCSGAVCAVVQRLVIIGRLPAAQKLCSWSAGIYVLILFLDRYLLTPFGCVEGYFGLHPLLPLVECTPLLQLLPSVGKNMLTIWWLAIPTTFVWYWLAPHWYKLVAVACSSSVWVLSSMVSVPPVHPPAWVSTIAPVLTVFPPTAHTSTMMKSAAHHFKRIIDTHQNIQLIVTPESSLYCDYVSLPAVASHWSQEYLGRPIHILAGAFRWQDDWYHNSMHLVYDGHLKMCFDKRHSMVLTERLPSWCMNSFVSSLYFSNSVPITPSLTEKKQFSIHDDITLVVYICSELFFNENPDDGYQDTAILALCNDRWVSASIARLMYSAARFRALQWQRDILYIGFLYHGWCDRYGNTSPIAVF